MMANEKMTEEVGQLRYDPTVIGSGFYSTVYSGFDSKSKTPVAVKQIQRTRIKEDEVKREVDVMRKAQNHSNILKYIDFELDKHFL